MVYFLRFFLYVKMDPDDNTAIIDMKKHFQKFVSGDDTRRRSRLDLSENSLLDSSHASVGRSYGRGKCANNFFFNYFYLFITLPSYRRGNGQFFYTSW